MYFLDAEPKYLIAVQPIPVNEVKKQCTGNDCSTVRSRITVVYGGHI